MQKPNHKRLEFLSDLKRNIACFIRSFFYYFFRVFPVKKNKIHIINFDGRGYGDNLKYIVEEILNRRLDYDIVWETKKEYWEKFPPSVRLVKHKSVKAIFESATAKIWIDNTRKQPYVRKRKKQVYIQTWHGSPMELKKVEKDAEDKLTPYYLKQAKNDSRLINILLSDSNVCTGIYKRAFWYNGEILECGFPKNDILINKPENTVDKVYKHFNIKKDINIILYAPTFRNNFDTSVYEFDYESILSLLSNKTGEKWVFLVRLHPNIAEKSFFMPYSDQIINASSYDDISELLLVSGMLISDYSGLVFDFLLTRKPVFLYIKDYADYLHERNFYVDLFSLPFPSAFTSSELVEKISNYDDEVYLKSLEKLFQQTKIFEDGKASKKVVDRIITEITNE
jgi:CDP-glycerol glycerophosphotransferase